MSLKLLHTSDWHLGHVLHDVDQAPEQRAFLTWLADLCERERVDALLVAGDVFDVSNPPASAFSMLARFLVDLWQRLPALQVIVIGGNHDSAHRLETMQPFTQALGRLHVLGALPRKDGAPDPDRAIIRVEASGGSALILAVPFLRPADLRVEDLEGDPAAPVRRAHDELVAAARARRTEGEALVVMGHLFVAGGTKGDVERTIVGGVGAVPPDAFPPDVAYGALGHLHRPQVIDGRLHYSGTPYPLSFDEAGYLQQVNLVELEGGTLKQVVKIPTPQTRALLRVPKDEPAPLAEVLATLAALPAHDGGPEDRRPLVEVRVRLERPEPSLRQQLDAALAGKAARLVAWKTQLTGTGAALGGAGTATALDDLDPVEVFGRRWAKQYPGQPPADLLALFAALLAEATEQVSRQRAEEVSP